MLEVDRFGFAIRGLLIVNIVSSYIVSVAAAVVGLNGHGIAWLEAQVTFCLPNTYLSSCWKFNANDDTCDNVEARELEADCFWLGCGCGCMWRTVSRDWVGSEKGKIDGGDAVPTLGAARKVQELTEQLYYLIHIAINKKATQSIVHKVQLKYRDEHWHWRISANNPLSGWCAQLFPCVGYPC